MYSYSRLLFIWKKSARCYDERGKCCLCQRPLSRPWPSPPRRGGQATCCTTAGLRKKVEPIATTTRCRLGARATCSLQASLSPTCHSSRRPQPLRGLRATQRGGPRVLSPPPALLPFLAHRALRRTSSISLMLRHRQRHRQSGNLSRRRRRRQPRRWRPRPRRRRRAACRPCTRR